MCSYRWCTKAEPDDFGKSCIAKPLMGSSPYREMISRSRARRPAPPARWSSHKSPQCAGVFVVLTHPRDAQKRNVRFVRLHKRLLNLQNLLNASGHPLDLNVLVRECSHELSGQFPTTCTAPP